MIGFSWICSRCLARSARTTLSHRAISQQRNLNTSSHLSPALLTRARSLATEHTRLSAQLTDSFDAKIAKRVGELASIAQALQEWDRAHESLSELRSLIEDPETDDELRSLALEDVKSSDRTLPAISKTLKNSLVPRHPFADLPCLLEIRPGAGGDEAGLFAFELLRMYTAFCTRRGLRSNVIKLDVQDGPSDDRLSEAVVEIDADGAYDLLRTESGVHRVQRVPATETKGRTHTSAVSVMVLPSFPEAGASMDSALNFDDPNSDYYVDPQEVRTEKMRASGAGGQHVNKTESAIRLTHIPTGIVVSMQDSRSQHANRKKAWQVLRAKLAEARQEAREQELVELRRGVLGGVARMGRGDKIRTYNYGQSRCTDHRSGITVHNLDNVLDGGESLETIMDSVRTWLADREIAAISAEDSINAVGE
ncbi:peptide chain release factor 1 [Aspergillus lentulus]|nr:peptide chain release factor 1 [Aspergillus lentulus]GFF49636.1 peptide chain release factor 1 [Aspergillus lentulus]GFF60983.1 peptide chain release factor 1 [Aspergillus lentulus]GFF83228.1 peptide chain release factor 1 [Aspergillus lentulus]GFF91068.1 peptide chain release factor 1 [Aspergillus lentulus]GFF99952.1 peptide chain release factor 1 [Aspergillus lentulus]